MPLADNIKALREARGLKQIEVARYIELNKSAYSKTESGQRNATVEELAGMAELFGVTIDEIVNHQPGDDGAPPERPAVSIADESAAEQLRLIASLDEDDRRTVYAIVDKMLTNKKFHDFFEEHVTAAAVR